MPPAIIVSRYEAQWCASLPRGFPIVASRPTRVKRLFRSQADTETHVKLVASFLTLNHVAENSPMVQQCIAGFPMATLKDNRTLKILNAAATGGYGVLSAIAYNLEHLTALIRAAEAKRSPLIIQLFPTALTQLPLLAHAAAIAVNIATVPLSLHIDHAQDVENIREIITTLPVDSVMVDMSHYDEAENLEKTRILTKECHDRGIAVEAESGRIEGGEDGISDTGDLEALFTSPSDIDNFIAAGIDILAPSIGNIHGDYGPAGPKEGQLHFDRLETLTSKLTGAC